MFESEDICDSFGIPIEVRKLAESWKGKNSRTEDSLWGIKDLRGIVEQKGLDWEGDCVEEGKSGGINNTIYL